MRIATVCVVFVAGIGIGFLLNQALPNRPNSDSVPPLSPGVPANPNPSPPTPPDLNQITPPPIEITLRAFIDGSDRFVFSGQNLWNEHMAWQPPKNVLFNGQPWTDLTIAPPGWPELAESLDLSKAAVVARKGRDVIALEPTRDGFDLFLADSQMGGATYEVTISIPRNR